MNIFRYGAVCSSHFAKHSDEPKANHVSAVASTWFWSHLHCTKGTAHGTVPEDLPRYRENSVRDTKGYRESSVREAKKCRGSSVREVKECWGSFVGEAEGCWGSSVGEAKGCWGSFVRDVGLVW